MHTAAVGADDGWQGDVKAVGHSGVWPRPSDQRRYAAEINLRRTAAAAETHTASDALPSSRTPVRRH